MQKILVSACLLGERVRFDGQGKLLRAEPFARWRHEGRLVAICPEVTGGLGIPRAPAELQGGTGDDVLEGRAAVRSPSADVTAAFLAGARAALELAQANHVRIAVLKARSPSCGRGRIYDGTFSKTERDGSGVTAALLARSGIAIFTEEELDRAEAHLLELERGG